MKVYHFFGGVAISALVATAALAQSADDIVITARKREESIMKVPIVTTTLNAKQLDQYASEGLNKIADQIPGLVIGQSQTANGAQVSLRGVGTSVLNPGIDQSISLVLDGQQLTQGMAYTAAFFDLQQFTVLKGPQSLFYGKASPGGVISVQSANPGSHFELIARAGYETEANTMQTDVIVSGPVSSTLGLRLAARYEDSQGYFNNVITATPSLGGVLPHFPHTPDMRQGIVRGTAQWEPTDRLTARLKLTYTKRQVQGDMGSVQITSCPDGTAGVNGIPFMASEDCKLDRNEHTVDNNPAVFIGVPHDGIPYANTSQVFAVGELNYLLTDQLKLTSLTSIYKMHEDDSFNATSASGAASALASATDFHRRDINEEVRLTSTFSGDINFTLGGFYSDTYDHKTGTAFGNTALRLPVLLLKSYNVVTVQTGSIFGQGIWNITPKLELAAGVRWDDDTRHNNYTALTTGVPVPIALAKPRLHSDHFSPEVTLTYTPTDDLTIFGAFKKGYKSGSFNMAGSYSNGQDSSFGDEQVEGGEVGIKARLMDHQLTFNVAGYDYKYKDLQVGASGQTNGGLIIVQTLNAASSRIYGVDADLNYHPTAVPGLVLRAAGNWNHARYIDFSNAPCWGGQEIAEGCNRVFNATTGLYTAQDISGAPLLRAPDWSVDLSGDYTMKLAHGRSLSFAALGHYSSRYVTDILVRSDFYQPAFWKFNLSTTLHGAKDRWQFSVIANNLTDKLVRSNCIDSNLQGAGVFGGVITGGTTRGVAGINELSCSIDTGREIWLRLGFKF